MKIIATYIYARFGYYEKIHELEDGRFFSESGKGSLHELEKEDLEKVKEQLQKI